MAGKDSIMVRHKELKRIHVIHKVIEGEIMQRKAAELASFSERQIRRLVKRIQAEGEEDLAGRCVRTGYLYFALTK